MLALGTARMSVQFVKLVYNQSHTKKGPDLLQLREGA